MNYNSSPRYFQNTTITIFVEPYTCKLEWKSKTSDFGLKLSKDINGVIERVEKGSSADLQGLKKHDQLFCINGKNILGEDSEVTIGMLDDATKSNLLHVQIGVLRPNNFDLSQGKE